MGPRIAGVRCNHNTHSVQLLKCLSSRVKALVHGHCATPRLLVKVNTLSLQVEPTLRLQGPRRAVPADLLQPDRTTFPLRSALCYPQCTRVRPVRVYRRLCHVALRVDGLSFIGAHISEFPDVHARSASAVQATRARSGLGNIIPSRRLLPSAIPDPSGRVRARGKSFVLSR